MEKTNRILWIDCMKGIGMILVVFAHLNPALPIEKFIYSFHMFLFFFISGFLHRSHPEINKSIVIRKKFFDLMVPFFVWDTIASAYSLVRGSDLKEVAQQFFIFHGKTNWNSPIWFLWILFVVECVFIFIDSYQPRTVQFIILAISLFTAFVLRGHNFPFKLGIVPIGLFFFCAGILFNRLNLINRISSIRFPLLFICLAATIVFSQLNDRISVINTEYGTFVLCILAGISGVLFTVLLCNLVFSNHRLEALERIGKDSLLIMCVQYPVFLVLSALSSSLIGVDAWHDRGNMKALIDTAITLAIIYLAIIPVLKRLPVYISKPLGYRT